MIEITTPAAGNYFLIEQCNWLKDKTQFFYWYRGELDNDEWYPIPETVAIWHIKPKQL